MVGRSKRLLFRHVALSRLITLLIYLYCSTAGSGYVLQFAITDPTTSSVSPITSSSLTVAEATGTTTTLGSTLSTSTGSGRTTTPGEGDGGTTTTTTTTQAYTGSYFLDILNQPVATQEGVAFTGQPVLRILNDQVGNTTSRLDLLNPSVACPAKQ